MASLARGEDASPDRAARFAPGHRYRSPVLDAPDRRTIAVLPFVNDSGRRDAGQAVALDFTEQLVRTGAFDVVEPGQSRREMLAYRVILDGGVSLDNAMVVLEQIGADLVLSGSVLTYADSASREGAPEVQITAYVLDGRTKRVVWSSTSHAQGDDGVFFFGIGRVNAVAALASRMAREVAERIAGERPRPKNTMAGARVAPSRRADWRPIRETSDETP
jgi:TolB-like protein